MGRLAGMSSLIPFREDILKLGLDLPPGEVHEADVVRRWLERNRMAKELARAGIDPRPPRKRGRATR